MGTWDVPLNGDFNIADGYLGGVQTISVTNAPITLTSPAGFTPTPSAGPTQAQNAVLKLTGTPSAAVTITLPLPGYYIIDTVGLLPTTPVTLRAVGSGEVIGMAFGNVRQVYNDGTNVRHCNLQEVGTYLDYATTAVPGWITVCTKPPFLLCDGSTFSGGTYPQLAALLGGTTLPDFRGRNAYFLNGGTSRLTSAGAGIDGGTLFASGGANGVTLSISQLPAHTHANTLNDPGHAHQLPGTFQNTPVGGGSNAQPLINTGFFSNSSQPAFTDITITNASTGAGANIPNAAPGAVGGIRLIRAA